MHRPCNLTPTPPPPQPPAFQVTAPRILRVARLSEFVQEKLQLELPRAPGGGAACVAAADHIQILTPDGTALPKHMDLASVVQFHRPTVPPPNGASLILQYRCQEVMDSLD